MKVTTDLNLRNFNFWSGAKEHEFNNKELNSIESELECLYPEGLTEAQVNDLFWFEEDFLCECIGLDYNEYLER